MQLFAKEKAEEEADRETTLAMIQKEEQTRIQDVQLQEGIECVLQLEDKKRRMEKELEDKKRRMEKEISELDQRIAQERFKLVTNRPMRPSDNLSMSLRQQGNISPNRLFKSYTHVGTSIDETYFSQDFILFYHLHGGWCVARVQ